MFNYSRLPEPLQCGARLWIEKGILPGGFLTAVLCNDLRETAMLADYKNARRIPEIVGFWYNEAPVTCWGTRGKIAAWHAHNGLAGIDSEVEPTQARPLEIVPNTP